MLKRLAVSVATMLAVGALGFGANAAYAASNVLTVAQCPIDPPGSYNWCAPSLGGQSNCDACCQLYEYAGGLCLSFDETTKQDCLCYEA